MTTLRRTEEQRTVAARGRNAWRTNRALLDGGAHGLPWAHSVFLAVAVACGDVRTDLIVRETTEEAGCITDENCDAETPRCELSSRRCVVCLDTGDCDADQVCALPAARCVTSCLVSGACGDERPICDPGGVCRGCEGDDECPSAAPRCNAAGACVECRDPSDCTEDSDAPFCAASGRCVECTSDGHCDDEDERCSAVLGECATPCSENDSSGAGGCGSDDPICDPDIGFCVECRRDEDCDSDERCLASECEDD